MQDNRECLEFFFLSLDHPLLKNKMWAGALPASRDSSLLSHNPAQEIPSERAQLAASLFGGDGPRARTRRTPPKQVILPLANMEVAAYVACWCK